MKHSPLDAVVEAAVVNPGTGHGGTTVAPFLEKKKEALNYGHMWKTDMSRAPQVKPLRRALDDNRVRRWVSLVGWVSAAGDRLLASCIYCERPRSGYVYSESPPPRELRPLSHCPPPHGPTGAAARLISMWLHLGSGESQACKKRTKHKIEGLEIEAKRTQRGRQAQQGGGIAYADD